MIVGDKTTPALLLLFFGGRSWIIKPTETNKKMWTETINKREESKEITKQRIFLKEQKKSQKRRGIREKKEKRRREGSKG